MRRIRYLRRSMKTMKLKVCGYRGKVDVESEKFSIKTIEITKKDYDLILELAKNRYEFYSIICNDKWADETRIEKDLDNLCDARSLLLHLGVKVK